MIILSVIDASSWKFQTSSSFSISLGAIIVVSNLLLYKPPQLFPWQAVSDLFFCYLLLLLEAEGDSESSFQQR